MLFRIWGDVVTGASHLMVYINFISLREILLQFLQIFIVVKPTLAWFIKEIDELVQILFISVVLILTTFGIGLKASTEWWWLL